MILILFTVTNRENMAYRSSCCLLAVALNTNTICDKHGLVIFTTCLILINGTNTNFELSLFMVAWRSGGGGGGGGETVTRPTLCLDSKRARVCIQNVSVCAGKTLKAQ